MRSFVTKRKISGETRSTAGKQARDTFLSLLKTCAKLAISFWDYLGARLKIPDADPVPWLPDLDPTAGLCISEIRPGRTACAGETDQVRRGDLTIWVTLEALADWTPPRTGRRGRSQHATPTSLLRPG